MRLSILILTALALASTGWSQQRTAVEAPARSQHVDAAIEHLEAARAALAEWRRAVDAGAQAEPADVRRLESVMRGLGEEFKHVYRQSQARSEAARPPVRAGEIKDRELENRARALSKVWVDDGRAIGAEAAERKAQALDEVRAALESVDAIGNLAALRTLQRLGDVEYDKASFRPLVLPFARDSRGPLLNAALYALANTVKEKGDVALVHAGWERDPEALRSSVLHLMFLLDGGDLKGRSEQIALEVLDESSDHLRTGMSGMWGARVGPALEARVLELARAGDSSVRHDAIYYGLSTFQDKSAAVVEELIASLGDPDHNNSGRALWGLTHGVPEAQRPRAVEAALELHAARSDRGTRERCEHIVRKYGTPADLAKLGG